MGHLRQGHDEGRGRRSRPASTHDRRQGIRRAHSATHILHYALQKHLGKHAQQQGSKVEDDWLRFDFAQSRARSTREQLAAIEHDVNERVADVRADPVEVRCRSPRPARPAR